MTNYFSYKLEHDFGLAPNPFWGYCTLAVCKPRIRRNSRLKKGDWIFGTGSSKLKNLHHLIYAMEVEEKLTFNEYWTDPRFLRKRPIINGSLVQMYGDNIYHQNEATGEWIQEDSAHSKEGGIVNERHRDRDVGGEFVIIASKYFYFGKNAQKIPEKYLEICCEGRDTKSVSIPVKTADHFVKWLEKTFEPGIHGDPIDWDRHK